MGKKHKKAADDVKPLHFNIAALEQKIKDEQAALLAGHKDFLKWSEAHKDAESQIPKVTEVSDELNKSITRIIDNMKNVPPAFLNAEAQAKASMQGAVEKVQTLDAAYKTLGITSKATVQQQAVDFEAAYETIKNDANSSIADIERAWVAMEEKRIAAAIAAGETVSAARIKELEDYKKTLDQKLPEAK